MPGARPEHVEHGYPTRLLRRAAADIAAFQRVHDLFCVDVSFELLPGLELFERACRRLERTQVQPSRVRHGRAAEPMGGRQHRGCELADGIEARLACTKRVEERQRLPAQLQRLLLDALRRVNGSPAQPALEKVDVVTAQTRVRRAHECVEVVPAAAEPGEAKE